MGLMGREQLESVVQAIKSKVMRSLKKTKKKKKGGDEATYVKMDKSSSIRVEMESRNARRLIDRTLKAADHPGKASIPF